MRRQHRSMGLALTVVLLASCARSGVDDKIASTSDSEQAKVADTSNVVVTGSRIAAPQLRAESIPPMAVMAPPGPSNEPRIASGDAHPLTSRRTAPLRAARARVSHHWRLAK